MIHHMATIMCGIWIFSYVIVIFHSLSILSGRKDPLIKYYGFHVMQGRLSFTRIEAYYRIVRVLPAPVPKWIERKGDGMIKDLI